MSKTYPYGYRHAALNLFTGEIISCPTGTHLKRSIALRNRYERAGGFPCGAWVFTHSGDFRPEQYAGAPYLR